MEGQRVTGKPFSPDSHYSENFMRMVVREFEMGHINKGELGRWVT